MATYTEIRSLFNDADLLGKVEVATIVAANALLEGTPTVEDRKYAASVFSNPRVEAEKCLMVVLAANSNAPFAAIQSASDVDIQVNVTAAVPALVSALSGV